ncbi:sugar transferase [Corynebacterium pacaense]|uniref:sugar transferase n=1 Tax=Corynebacterium pacaense TaxID=1816684 RepID=UPI0015C42B2C|nr:sugar transferase [Corynebacterium pacaense]
MRGTVSAGRGRLRAKRVIDTALILATAPLTLAAGAVTAVLVRIFMGSPVLYRQNRIGRDEQPFELLKFRSMLPETTASGAILTDGERLTAFGRLLRKSSLDEIPQLINVLRGEMSLVGPRPLLVHYLPFYTDLERRRHEVRPGITGAAQVGGRNLLGWDERLAIDAEYARHGTLRDDLGIIIRTVEGVIRSEGVVEDESTVIEDLDVHRSRPGTGSHSLRRITAGDPSAPDPLMEGGMDPAAYTVLAVIAEGTDRPIGIVGFERSPGDGVPLVQVRVDPDRAAPDAEAVSLALLLEFMRDQGGFTGAAALIPGRNSESIRVHSEMGFSITDPAAAMLRLELRP